MIRIAWIEANGTKYSPHNAAELEVTELPTFGVVIDIVSSGASY